MTLEEAEEQEREAYSKFYESRCFSKEEGVYLTEWRKIQDKLAFFKSTPTQQLCSVAREIANEKE